MCSNNRDITAKDLSEMGLTLKLGTKKYPKLGIKNTLVFLTEPVQMFFDSWFSDTSFSIIYINTYSRWACCYNTIKSLRACINSLNWSLRVCCNTNCWGQHSTCYISLNWSLRVCCNTNCWWGQQHSTTCYISINRSLRVCCIYTNWGSHPQQVLVHNVHWGHNVRFSCLLQTDDCVIITCNNKYLV